jgi:hypothetical protein
MRESLIIGTKTYHKTDGVFEVPLSELGDLHFTELPYYSTVAIRDARSSDDSYHLDISATHGGGPSDEFFSLNFHVAFWLHGDWNNSTAVDACNRRLRHIRRFFRDLAGTLALEDGEGERHTSAFKGRLLSSVLYSRTFERQQDPRLAAFIDPFVRRFGELLTSKDPLLFICHASEDKPFVESLCAYLDERNVPVWYDRREIKVGQSIVQRINEGLDSASHLVIVLSQKSVEKPWVLKECGSALMRQLQDASIIVVPIMVDDCSPPSLLADIKYADCRGRTEEGFHELCSGILGLGSTGTPT